MGCELGERAAFKGGSPMSCEVAFIDPSIPELDTFLAGLRPDLEAILLSPKCSAPTQIAEALSERADLDAIHIVAHGAPGVIRFSSGSLTIDTLPQFAAHLAAIGEALGPEGELLLWSCETGRGPRGACFIDALESLTGACVAASAQLIGCRHAGGSWALNGRSGSKQAPLSAEAVGQYGGVLITVDLDTNVSGVGSFAVSTFTEGGVNTPLFGNATIDTTPTFW